MFTDHYTPLVIAYFVGFAGWLLASRLFPRVWPKQPAEPFPHAWKELGFALLGCVGIILVGQLWSHGIRLPEDGTFGPLFSAINQLFIFAPLIVVLWLRRQPLRTWWLPGGHWPWRVVIGFVLACFVVTAYSLLRVGAASPLTMIGRIWAYANIGTMMQVFLEDLTIAVIFIRLAGAIGRKWATILVPCLFAAGHIPALVAQGVSVVEMTGLLRDAALGVGAVLVLQRSRDIVWFWFIHFCLDMTQFAHISGLK